MRAMSEPLLTWGGCEFFHGLQKHFTGGFSVCAGLGLLVVFKFFFLLWKGKNKKRLYCIQRVSCIQLDVGIILIYLPLIVYALIIAK